MEQPAAIKLEKPKKAVKKKAHRKSHNDPFTLHLMKLIDKDVTDKSELQKLMKIAPKEFEEKLQELQADELIIIDSGDSNKLWKTVTGFNEFPLKEKKERKRDTNTESVLSPPALPNPPLQQVQEKTTDKDKLNPNQPTEENQSTTLKEMFEKKQEIGSGNELKTEKQITVNEETIIFEPRASEEQIAKYFDSREGEIDLLEELIKKGAPKQGQLLPKLKHFGERLLTLEDLLKKGAPINSVQTKIVPEEQQADFKQVKNKAFTTTPSAAAAVIVAAADNKEKQPETNERCGLCKSPFKLSMQDNSMAKFGHCFCGSAYHKDCYEHILTGDKRCLKCNSEMKMQLDQKSKEALGKIREMF